MASGRPIAAGAEQPQSQIIRTVVVSGRRTSIRMESIFWQLIDSISGMREMSLNELLSEIDARRGSANLTAAARVFAVAYFKDVRPDYRTPAGE